MKNGGGEFGKNRNNNGPSRTAELMAQHRRIESLLPDDEGICYDPHAVHFCDPQIPKYVAKQPTKAKAKADEAETLLPGLGNSIRARVRYFDDFVMAAVEDRIRQLVILGAGYDTRAYRIGSLKCHVRVFEVDRPETQDAKKEKIREIFATLPDHVIYVPLDIEREDLAQALAGSGYSRSEKTLFVMEGLLMYIAPEAVDEILGFIARNSGKGSVVIFDYYPLSLVDWTDQEVVARNIRDFTRMAGEPLQFGMPDGKVVRFLAERGYIKVRNVTGRIYRSLYFQRKNAGRKTCDYLSWVSAKVQG